MNPMPETFETPPAAGWREWQQGRAVNFFQTSHWADLLASHYPNLIPSPIESEEFCIPLMRKRRWGWLSDSLYGMPLMTTGGVWFRREGTEQLWRKVYARLARARVGTMAIVFPPGEKPPTEKGFQIEIDTTHLIDLTGGWDQVWKGYKQRGRTAARRAEKAGVEVRRDETEGAIRSHWNIIQEHSALWNPNPAPTFDFVSDAARSHAGRLYIAEQDGRTVGSLLAFAHGLELFLWQGGRTREDPPPGTFNLLFGAAFQEACKDGLERANLGSSLGMPALDQFKRSVGGVKTEFCILKRDHPCAAMARKWLLPR